MSSASQRVVVKELSSSLLDMKFMLKQKKQIESKVAKRKEAKLEQAITEKEVDAAPCSSAQPVQEEICMNYAKLENLMFGRMSFNGFNKDVEALMSWYERRRNGEVSDEEEEGKDVDDQEMAESLGGQKLAALSKKAQTKRERRQQSEKNEETSGGRRFNFKDIRKRYNDGELDGEEEPKRKFMRPKEE